MTKVEQSLQRRQYIIWKFYNHLTDNTQHIKTKSRKLFCPTSEWEEHLSIETFNSGGYVYGRTTANRKIYRHRNIMFP